MDNTVLQAGQRREIHNAGISGNPRIEGVAVLIRKIHDGPEQEYWEVQFPPEKETYGRWVKKPGAA